MKVSSPESAVKHRLADSSGLCCTINQTRFSLILYWSPVSSLIASSDVSVIRITKLDGTTVDVQMPSQPGTSSNKIVHLPLACRSAVVVSSPPEA